MLSMAAGRASSAGGSWGQIASKEACLRGQGMGRYRQKAMMRAMFVGPKSWQKLMYLSA